MTISMLANIRKSGLPLVGDLPWGSHFCQLYRTREDLLDILVPYFKAGLENNEFCLWVISEALEVEDARQALLAAGPEFAEQAIQGRMEIVPRRGWKTRGDGAVVAMLDRAITSGFDGLRLACHAAPGKPATRPARVATPPGFLKEFSPHGAEVFRRLNVIAAFAYPHSQFDAMGLMEIVKNHRFALVRNAGGWEVIESSEARTVKDELERSEEKLRSLFSNMSEGFAYHRIVLDDRRRPCDYIFLEVNEAFERLTGLEGRRVIGRQVTEVLPGIEKDPADWIGRYGKVAMTGEPAQFESYSEELDQWYAVSAFSPHKGYFAVTFGDITERKRAEREIGKLNEELKKHVTQLEAANRELDSFSYSVSHDLRAPLRSVAGFSQALIEDCADALDADGRDHLQRIMAATHRMGQLIDDLLNLSRVSRAEMKQESVDLGRIARGILARLGNGQPERQVEIMIGNDLMASGDRNLLAIVLENLLNNAWKFTGQRSPAVIEFGCRNQAPLSGPEVMDESGKAGAAGGRESADKRVYFVKDNGAGFDMSYAGKLFSAFQRLHDNREYVGTGIGLATVKRIVGRHGGSVWIEGEVGKGATVYFTL